MSMRSVVFLGRLLLVLILWAAAAAQPAHAATTWVVNSLGDSAGGGICTLGNCSLRSAINVAASGDTITFAPSVSGTIHLNFGGLTIAKNLTIRGPGAYVLTVDGTVNNAAVFRVNAGTTLSLSGLSINHGRNDSGAGINNYGNLTVDQCSFFDHTAQEDDGGALYNNAGGTVTISRSYFGGNHAQGFGGAIANDTGGVMSITNSTFTANGANAGGGAIDNLGSLSITNSTIKDNGAVTAGGVINEAGASVTLKNVLLADNSGGNCGGVLAAGSTHNLSTDGTCTPGFTQVTPADLALGALMGIPAYFPLNDGSVAIDTGANNVCPPIDQTGKPRPIDGNRDGTAVCDVGAYEAWPANVQFIFFPMVLSY